MSEREVILKAALTSRFFLITIQYVSNLLIPDHEADAYTYPKNEDNGIFDKLVTHLLGGFVRWDAHHFMHIAIFGYTYEHTLAFFPLFPYSAKPVVAILSYLLPFLSTDSLTLITLITVNIFCFAQSALCLYQLSALIMNKDLALKAAILFCCNPASVFFTAPYSESLFCYLTFKSMLNSVLLYKKYKNQGYLLSDVAYIIPICLSTCTRSNGVLNIGFLAYALICLFLEKIKLEKQICNLLLCLAKFITLAAVLVLICLVPFICFQFYGYQTFCKNFKSYQVPLVLGHKNIDNFVLPGTFSQHNQSWCYKKMPLAYSYIQSHYWKVGFLQYYELKQIPNFLLASPIILIILGHSLHFLKEFPKSISKLFNFDLISVKSVRTKKFFPVMAVFIVHASVLTLFCVFNIHVQVTTRMLCSASPVIYWFCSYYVTDVNLFKNLIARKCNWGELLVLSYFLGYYFVGTVMFCNFLPWT
ncbi:GPI mannosyltransferase-like [Tribolium castaneum]|uniref:GPI mannosyltransferase 2 n=1 Tax=Tribolium castaneum TaxID=7070 RepID=B8PUN0_TRICA|nr:GPI mannosyltransferase-like [Tribolium castaneum]XP_008194184.1 PREDICTED: GPI mannosyltransferase-like isoform X1 [Tribolium castaneum]XP_008194185.1 PREDICTED: GPI mannosyltransferase-like isoform X1 [Tribolium castaneum]XP_008194186.1 PREDICTED: GPI mannosyltransferase-like isoform X1 [Tribolium castaneum]XP_008194187.1 PREDICTED: GPI mannosyltransferase-like isoform X1 [Tribolium castaneum]ABY40601.1 gustatory receptor [Tribolium castaneum]EFA04392.1 GPI mannosyltransferase 2-like Pro|eukprot:NP_001138958.1 GPI mannosyltransferase-like [Tribolium castaneum]